MPNVLDLNHLRGLPAGKSEKIKKQSPVRSETSETPAGKSAISNDMNNITLTLSLEEQQ